MKTVKIKMLETTKGCDNDLGKYQVEIYFKDATYIMGSDLANAFIEGGQAKEAKEEKAPKKEKKTTKAKEDKQTKGDEDK